MRVLSFALTVQALIPCTYGQLTLEEIGRRYTRRTPRGVHFPILKIPRNTLEARGIEGAVGLGDNQDVLYTALLTVGRTTTPLIVDTGSSDLWVMSDACTIGCNGSAAVYPQATLRSAGLGVTLAYGDSKTGTFATGLIGVDKVGLGEIILNDQNFAAINRTNTSLAAAGAAGIFGIGFPIISGVWTKLFLQTMRETPERRRLENTQLLNNLVVPSQYSRRHGFPDIADLLRPKFNEPHPQTRQTVSGSILRAIFSSWRTIGPFVPRLIAQGALSLPIVSVTLQRTTMDVGGNLGMLSIGELPTGVNISDLIWVPLRNYSDVAGGLPAPPDSPNEEYPLTWEVMIDDVYLDGEKLPRSTLAPSSLGLSALIDTGNSLLRGPLDVVSYVYEKLGSDGIFRCAEPHNLSFQIGGKLFPVDPRDFATQSYINNVELCSPNLVSTDPPRAGSFLFSWSLGTPFLKGVLSSYYFGNLSYPSKDQPKMGFLSTVPNNAPDLMMAAVSAAQQSGNFPATSQPAPTAPPTRVRTSPTQTSRSRAACYRICVKLDSSTHLFFITLFSFIIKYNTIVLPW